VVGWIGGRLVPALLRLGHDLTLASRDPSPLAERFPTTRVVAADLLDPDSLGPAVEGVEVAFFRGLAQRAAR
jgi:uncharacterized protein YbjT (DUF2867 family)